MVAVSLLQVKKWRWGKLTPISQGKLSAPKYYEFYVPEVLNVHVNENNKKIYYFWKDFFFASTEKLTFEKANVILFNTFLNLNLFYWIVVNFL